MLAPAARLEREHRAAAEREEQERRLAEGIRAHTAAMQAACEEMRREIAERRELEARLQESEQKYRTLFATSTDAIFFETVEGRILDCNERACKMLGYTREELLQRSVSDLVPEEVVRILPDLISQEMAHHGFVVRAANRCKDGALIPVEVNAQVVELQGQPRVIVVVRDVSQRKRTEDLQAALYRIAAQSDAGTDVKTLGEQIFRELAALLPVTNYCLALRDEETGRITFPVYQDEREKEPVASPQGKSLADHVLRTGCCFRLSRPGAAEELQAAGILPPGAETRDWLGVPLRHGAQTFGLMVVRKYGEEPPFGLEEENLLMYLANQVAGMIRRKLVEEALRDHAELLRQAQKMEALGRLASGVAHDFNNMLTAMLGFSRMALDKLAPEHPSRADLREVMHAGDSAVQLTQKLLTFGRRQAAHVVPLELGTVLESMLTLLRRTLGEDIELITEFNDHGGVIQAEAGNLEQVLLNLAINAREAMPRGGMLRIATARVTWKDDPANRQAVARPGEYVRLTVRDTGCGMTPEIRERIFEPFFSTKAGSRNMGLGLALVYGIIRQCRGFIELDSGPGQGTEFRLFFPHRGDLPMAPAAGDASVAPSGRETVLVAEDNELVRRFAAGVLRGIGYRVVEARDGREALDLYTVADPPVDLVFTDIIMPRMSGLELADQLRKRKPDLKLIFTTGFAEESILQRGREHSPGPLLPKPFTPEHLAQKVREILDRKPTA